MSFDITEIGPPIPGLKEEINKLVSENKIKLDWKNEISDSIEEKLNLVDFAIVNGDECLEIYKTINHRSVGSHFLNYIDFVFKDDNKSWGYSTFTEAFVEVFRSSIKSHDYKGSVIFLGHNHLVAPTLSALNQFGFNEFVFLELDEPLDVDHYLSHKTGLFDVKVSKVNSQAFIQSQKEYSLCFSMYDNYPQQTLDDMSYFHFLSNQSMVFDLSGNSNFLFEEVKALGVEVVDYQQVLQVRKKYMMAKFLEIANKMS